MEILGITIHITKENIADGNKKDCKHCPTALAIKDAFPSVQEVDVDIGYIRIDGRWFETPKKIENFINRFDYCPSRSALRSVKFQLQKEVGKYGVGVVKEL